MGTTTATAATPSTPTLLGFPSLPQGASSLLQRVLALGDAEFEAVIDEPFFANEAGDFALAIPADDVHQESDVVVVPTTDGALYFSESNFIKLYKKLCYIEARCKARTLIDLEILICSHEDGEEVSEETIAAMHSRPIREILVLLTGFSTAALHGDGLGLGNLSRSLDSTRAAYTKALKRA